jgi:hypothetical protein
MRQLLLLTPDQIQSGIWKTNKAAGALWQEGNNVVFRNNGVEKLLGATQFGDAGDQVRDFAQAYISTTAARRAYITTDTKVRMFELLASVWTPTDLLTWPTASQYSDIETWGTRLLATNGIDPVKVWKNTGTMVNLGGVPFTKAKILKRKTPFLLAFNTNNIGDTAAEWSTDSDIETWTPGTSRAGNYNIRDLESEIVAVEDLGDRLAVYSRNSLVLGQFIGGANVFGWQRAVRGIGAVSRRSVVSLDPFNYGLAQDGIFKTDGVSFQWVDDPAMTKFIKDNADFTKASLFWGMADSTTKSVWFNFQDANSVWMSLQYYPDRNFFTKGNLQLSAGATKEVFDFPLVGSEDWKLGLWQTADTHFGSPLNYNLKTKPLDFGERSVHKLMQLIRVDGVWDPASMIRVQALQHAEDAAPVTVIDRALDRNNYFEFEAPFFTVEFYGSTKWSLNAMEFFGEVGGPVL